MPTETKQQNIHKVKSVGCCVLHNLCEMNGDEYREEWDVTALN